MKLCFSLFCVIPEPVCSFTYSIWRTDWFQQNPYNGPEKKKFTTPWGYSICIKFPSCSRATEIIVSFIQILICWRLCWQHYGKLSTLGHLCHKKSKPHVLATHIPIKLLTRKWPRKLKRSYDCVIHPFAEWNCCFPVFFPSLVRPCLNASDKYLTGQKCTNSTFVYSGPAEPCKLSNGKQNCNP